MNIEEPDIVRALPSDTDTEASVLGVLMCYERSLIEFAPIISTEMFLCKKHKVIAESILRLLHSGVKAEMLAVSSDLKKHKQSEIAGGVSYLSEILANVVSSHNLESNIRYLQELQMRREVITECAKASSEAYDASNDPIDLVSRIGTMFDSSLDRFCDRAEVAAKDLAPQTVISLRRKLETRDTGIPSGFDRIDKQIGGFVDNRLYIIAARPAMGKTSLALSALYNAAKAGKNAVLFSLEMDNEEIMKRLLAIHSSVSSNDMDKLTLNQSQLDTLYTAADSLSCLPMNFDDTPSASISHIRARCVKLKRQGKLDIIFIDYLQLLSIDRAKNANLSEQLGQVTISLKKLAKELRVPVVVLCQLNREVEKRADKEPMLSDLRDSGSIEQDADVVIFLWRPEYYGATEYIQTAIGQLPPQGLACIKVGKNRHGPTFITHLRFEADLTRFSDLRHPDPQPMQFNSYPPITPNPF